MIKSIARSTTRSPSSGSASREIVNDVNARLAVVRNSTIKLRGAEDDEDVNDDREDLDAVAVTAIEVDAFRLDMMLDRDVSVLWGLPEARGRLNESLTIFLKLL